MRILNVNATLDAVWGGGGAERIRRLSCALARQGHQVTILTTGFDSATFSTLRLAAVDVVALKCLNKRFMLPVIPLVQLRRLVNDHDVIHLCGHWTLLNVVIYFLAQIARKPYVVSPVGTLPRFGRSQKLKMVYNLLAGRALIRNAHAHIAVTPKEIDQFAEYGVDTSRVLVIPNGVDTEAFNAVDSQQFRTRHALGTAPLILFMGRLNPIKGPDLLVEAFLQIADQFPSYLLVLAGPDEGMGASLRESAQQHGFSDRVRIISYVGGEEKTAAYRAATLLVIPSRQEAMSIVVLEGGAAGTPVLITDQCGFDVVAEIGGGMVVAAEATAIAAGLVSMLSDSGKLLEAGERLRNFVQRDFTWDVAASRLINVFETVLGGSAVLRG